MEQLYAPVKKRKSPSLADDILYMHQIISSLFGGILTLCSASLIYSRTIGINLYQQIPLPSLHIALPIGLALLVSAALVSIKNRMYCSTNVGDMAPFYTK